MKISNITLLLIFAILLFGCSTPESKTNENKQPNIQFKNDLPKMLVTTLDKVPINTYELQGNTILILFQPDCDHCQREAKEIRQHLDAFKEYKIYFISADHISAIQKFGKDYDLLGHTNIFFAFTTVDNVINNFGPIPAPSVYIYSNQRLLQKFNGEVAIEKILQAI